MSNDRSDRTSRCMCEHVRHCARRTCLRGSGRVAVRCIDHEYATSPSGVHSTNPKRQHPALLGGVLSCLWMVLRFSVVLPSPTRAIDRPNGEGR